MNARSHWLGRIMAALGLILSSPLSAVAALAIRADDGGPVLYRARRAGRGNREFTMYKFRTMGADASGGGAITGGTDVRVTRPGRWLRRFKIDELPQLINVVTGDMALVGPRPEDVGIVERHYTPFLMQSLDVLPGLTSPGSLSYFAEEANLPGDPADAERLYVDKILPRKIALDLVYVRNRDWRYDLELVLRTLASIVGLRRPFAKRQRWEQDQADALLAQEAAS